MKNVSIIDVVRDTRTVTIAKASGTTTYAAGDVISAGTGDGHHEFTEMGRSGGGGSGVIVGAQITISANSALLPDLQLWLFDTDIVAAADNAPFIPTDAEMKTLVGVLKFPVADFIIGLASGNATCQASPDNLPLDYGKLIGTSLYGQLVVRNAYIPITLEEFTVRLKFIKNP